MRQVSAQGTPARLATSHLCHNYVQIPISSSGKKLYSIRRIISYALLLQEIIVSKGAAATPRLTLYRSLQFSKNKVLQTAVRIGKLILSRRDEESEIDQRKVVEKIVGLVANDSTVDRMQRIVRLYNGINACKRRGNEIIGEHVEWFAGLGISHLSLTNSDQDSSHSQIFWIVLLRNARLSSQSSSNIISNLVASSKLKTSEAVQTMHLWTKWVVAVVQVLHNVTFRNVD